jgi:GNAT superfamily N-acetyltransferase
MTIRFMTIQDTKEVVALANLAFDDNGFLFATSDKLLELLRTPGYAGIVLTTGWKKKTLAYAIYEILGGKPLTLLVHEIATAPAWRRKGFASQLLKWIRNRADRHDIIAVASDKRLSAHKLLAKAGFRATKMHRGETADFYEFHVPQVPETVS